MALSKKEIDEISLYEFSSEGELLKEIQHLIHVFNVEREQIGAVYKSRKSVSAYLYYYFVTNIPRVEQAIERLGGAGIFGDHPIVEFGSGPGTLPIAMKNLSNQFHLVESSQLMQESGRAVLNAYAPEINFKYYSQYWDVPILNKPILCFSNSFNEIEEPVFWELVNQLDPEKVIFIEPGTKDVFRSLLPIRSKLIEKGLKIAYPCSSQISCPLEDKDDWCHQYLKLSHHPSIERLTQKLKRDRRIVPLIMHLYQRGEFDPPQGILFTKPRERKYGYDIDICESNQIEKYRVLKKRETYSRKALKELLAGTVLSYEKHEKNEVALHQS